MAVLLLFAAAREAAGTGREDVEGGTVGEVLAAARARHGSLFSQVLASSRVWRNGEPTTDDEAVGPADEVAVLPPVSGGWSGDARGGSGHAPLGNLRRVDPARIAHVLEPAYTADLQNLTMEDLRARRTACQAIEVALSYQRRMAQGRLDIVGAERNQRAGGVSAPHAGDGTKEMVEQLSGILADRGRAPGFGHLPQLMAPEVDDLDTGELDAIARPGLLAALADADDAELERLVDALTGYERGVSDTRHALHTTIDALQAEIARRYQTGEATVDTLLT